MKIKCIFQTNFCEKQGEYISELTNEQMMNARDYNALIWADDDNEFDTDLLKDELIFNVKMTIMELYDSNGSYSRE